MIPYVDFDDELDYEGPGTPSIDGGNIGSTVMDEERTKTDNTLYISHIYNLVHGQRLQVRIIEYYYYYYGLCVCTVARIVGFG